MARSATRATPSDAMNPLIPLVSRSGNDAASGSPTSPWMLPLQAASYLGVTIPDILPYVETGQLTLRRSPDQGLRFHRDDLDAVLLAVPPAEAVRLLAAEASTSPSNPVTTTDSAIQAASPSSTHVPLKEAATQLKTPYKTLLRLVHAGEIPATNLGSPTHPRFVVDPAAIRRLWDEHAQRDMRRRSTPSVTLDYSKLLGQTSKGVRRG